MICNFSYGQIKVHSSGYVSIGTTSYPSQPFEVRGCANFITDPNQTNEKLVFDNSGYYSSPCIHPGTTNSCGLGTSSYAYKQVWTYWHGSPSDSRIKENIREISGSLGLILKLNGVKYDLKKEYAYDESMVTDETMKIKLEKDRKDKLGFIAQDVEKILPEVVFYDDSADMYGIDYSKIVPVLVEAIKEQNKLILNLQNKVKETDTELKSAEQDYELIENGEAYLSQNQPNPFNENTTITYFLPSTIQKATFYIYDMNGKQLKSRGIAERENGSIVIYANELNPGIYYYSLIADELVIGTNNMILTD